MTVPFEQQLNFLDPQLIDSDGSEAVRRYRELVKERYTISRHIHTSYEDTKSMTPIERHYVLEFITDELQKQAEMYEKARQNIKD